MSKYSGLLGAIVEASDIKQELGVSADEAFAIQQERADERLRELRAAEEAARESNAIPFRRKH
jgi:hypothetical protein